MSSYGKDQGMGPSTQRKEAGFDAVMKMALSVSKGLPHDIFWYLDCNSGSGLNETCEGSPLVFLRRALALSRWHIRAEFCDSNSEAILQLRSNVQRIQPWLDDWQLRYYICDNSDFLPRVAEKIRQTERNPEYAFGLLLSDANSQSQGYPRFALRDFATEFRRIDLLIHFNISMQAMVDGAKKSGQTGFKQWLTPRELMAELPRPYWWVRNPSAGGAGIQRFITLYGHSWDRGHKGRFADFYSTDSPAGEKILNCYTGFKDGENLLPGFGGGNT